jgi:hypothetical protein
MQDLKPVRFFSHKYSNGSAAIQYFGGKTQRNPKGTSLYIGLLPIFREIYWNMHLPITTTRVSAVN